MPLVTRQIPAITNVFLQNENHDSELRLKVGQQQIMCGVLDQLTNLFQSTHSIFSELLDSLEISQKRISSLSHRIHEANLSVSAVEIKIEQGEAYLLNSAKVDFESQVAAVSNVFDKKTNSKAVRSLYEQIQSPPPLGLLDVFRTDGKSCLKAYSNPTFFIENWVQTQKKRIAEEKDKREQRRAKKAQISRNSKVELKSVPLKRKVYNVDPIMKDTLHANNEATTLSPLDVPVPFQKIPDTIPPPANNIVNVIQPPISSPEIPPFTFFTLPQEIAPPIPKFELPVVHNNNTPLPSPLPPVENLPQKEEKVYGLLDQLRDKRENLNKEKVVKKEQKKEENIGGFNISLIEKYMDKRRLAIAGEEESESESDSDL